MPCSARHQKKTEMKQRIFIVIIILISLSACKSKKAIEFKAAIDQKEQSALDILVGKGGPEETKLHCLIKRDLKGALAAVDKEELAFNQLIKEIALLSADGIPLGAELKEAAIAFYTELRDLHMADRQEILVQEATYDKDTEKSKKAIDQILTLNQDQQALFDRVNKKNEVLHNALEQFNKANNL